MLTVAIRNLELLTETDYMKKIKGGAIVSEIFEKLKSKSNGSLLPDRNIFIYSAHDVTLVNTMRALNISDQTSRKPDYAATLAFELHQGLLENRPSEYSVKVCKLLTLCPALNFIYICLVYDSFSCFRYSIIKIVASRIQSKYIFHHVASIVRSTNLRVLLNLFMSKTMMKFARSDVDSYFIMYLFTFVTFFIDLN